MIVDLPNRRATRLLARALAHQARPGDLLVLVGPLGAGKTFLVRALCRALGLHSEHRVTSPTFALIQELDCKPKIVHADLYRLNGPEQVADLGLEAARNDAVVIVEWGGPYIEALGGDALVVELSRTPRHAQLSATGPRSGESLAAVLAASPM